VRVPARRKDGVEIDVELTLSSVMVGGGQEVIVASLRDLRDRVELERQVLAQQRLAAQNAVMGIVAGAHTVEDAAAGALQAIGENLGWPLGTFWLVRDGRLRPIASWYAKELGAAEFVACSRERTMLEGEGLPGRAWQAGKPVWIEDVQQDDNFQRAKAAAKNGLRAAFAFPVEVEATVVGVVEFFQESPQTVDEELVRSVTTMGRQIGHCIERIQNQARERAATEVAEAARVEAQAAEKRARFLAEASAVLGASLDYEQTLRRVAELAVTSIADWCTVTALDDDPFST
jgi:GAF domain-containing protein